MQRNTTAWDAVYRRRRMTGRVGRRYPNTTLISWYYQHAPKPDAPRRVLDIGCGTSPSLSFFLNEGFEYFGIDVTGAPLPSPEQLEDGEWAGRVHLRTFEPPSLPFEDGYFCLVSATESLHLNPSAEDLKRTIAEIRRVLVTGGGYFLTVFRRDHWFLTEGHTRDVDANIVELTDSFPEPERKGMRYFIFDGPEQIREYCAEFSSCFVGALSWQFGEEPTRRNAEYVITGAK